MGTRKEEKQIKHKKQLQELGVEKVKTYFYTLPVIDNIFTACLFIGKANYVLARGVAVRSPLETFSKSEGRKLAYKRGMRALYKKQDSLPINNFPLRFNGKTIKRSFKTKTPSDVKLMNMILPSLNMAAADYNNVKIDTVIRKKKLEDKTEIQKIIKYDLPRNTMLYLTKDFFDYKSCYKPDLTPKELRLLKKD